jgi:predicted amidophosphoribosyltransferase
LLKQRRTPKQATSPTPRRRLQQQGSFRVKRSSDVSDKTILLVDDILTTGSTASAAARTLKNAGAKRVLVAVIAVSPLRM